MRIIEIAATKYQILRIKCTEPAGGAYHGKGKGGREKERDGRVGRAGEGKGWKALPGSSDSPRGVGC